LSKKGWILGDNIVVERVYANWKTERLPALAAELVRKRVDVITCDDETMVAAARATQSIPILFGRALMPMEQGLIESFAKPGRNLTGTAMHAGTEVATKRLEFLRAIARGDRLSWLWGGDTRFAGTVAGGRFDIAKMYESAAARLGFNVRLHFVPAPADIDKVFEEIVDWKAQAITGGGRQVFEVRNRVAEFALRNRLPLANNSRGYVEAGGLLSYGPPDSEAVLLGQGFVEYLDRILRGAKPAELPVIQPSRYELVINMKTAKTLGLTIPQSVLQRADETIQ
jgi:putative ABC transport system substrate-binding protein